MERDDNNHSLSLTYCKFMIHLFILLDATIDLVLSIENAIEQQHHGARPVCRYFTRGYVHCKRIIRIPSEGKGLR